MKKSILLLFAAFATLVASAQTKVEIEGIWYNLTSETLQAEVTSSDGTNYSGSITIPATVPHEGKEYNVTSIGFSAFESCSSLKSITIPESVTSIGFSAFDGCSSLADINIPKSVTSIEFRAFKGCSSLTDITIPENSQLTSIGGSVFQGCSSLKSIKIPESVTRIENYTFDGCNSLADITIPENSQLTSIGGSAFQGCSSLTAINIPEGVTSIGFRAFYGCSSLTAITIPENSQLTSIGDDAFSGCSSLTAITIPASVDVVGNKVFDDCTSLKEVIIEDGNTTLSLGYSPYSDSYYDYGVGLFYDCPLETVYLGRDLSYITGDSYGLSPFCGRNGSSTISITSATIGDSVTSIGRDTFIGCSALTSITIPKGITYIDEGAFYECYSLSLVTNYSGLDIQKGSYTNGSVALYADRAINVDEFIGDYAFKTKDNAHYLTGYIGDAMELTLPDNYQGENYQIGKRAFDGYSSLTSITIPEGVTSIGDEAFYGCRSLYKVINYSDLDIQKGNTDNGYVAYYAQVVYQGGELTTIGDFQFYTSDGIHSLVNYIGKDTEIMLPDSYNGESYNIGDYAFYKYSSLTSINIPEGVTSIGKYAFSDCSSLTAITIPEGVKSIGEGAFSSCSRLTDITIPENSQLTSIGDDAFSGCSSLTTITIPASVTSIGEWAFSGCSSLTAITIPEGVTSIGSYTFYHCSSLTAIILPEGVTSIGDDAFSGCSSLKELTLGKGLKKIAAEAFNSCTALEKVTIYATRPPSIEGTGNAFFSDATYENATLYVPQGCIDKYQVTTGWSSFYTIEEMESGTPNYLTLRQADNGEVGIVVEPGRTYKVRITAFEGWKIHSVTFNDTDVTTQLTAEGIYTTPALQADAVLNIAYEKIGTPTMVANARASRIKVQGHRGTLRITGATEGDDISVYTTDGTLVTQESAKESDTEITLPTGQVYIVKVADKVVKIGM